MNIVAIDPSLISTAVVAGGPGGFKILNYCRDSDVYGKKGMGKWYKACEGHVSYRMIATTPHSGYSEGEVAKLQDYDRTTGMVIGDLGDVLDLGLATDVGIEGYNFGAKVGDLVDLVAFSTILRHKLLLVGARVEVVSPMTLKQDACKLAYPPVDVGVRKPKLVWKNPQGIAGGLFTKREIFQSIVDSGATDYWACHCRDVADEILALRSVPKPYEDVNDAYVLYRRSLARLAPVQ